MKRWKVSSETWRKFFGVKKKTKHSRLSATHDDVDEAVVMKSSSETFLQPSPISNHFLSSLVVPLPSCAKEKRRQQNNREGKLFPSKRNFYRFSSEIFRLSCVLSTRTSLFYQNFRGFPSPTQAWVQQREAKKIFFWISPLFLWKNWNWKLENIFLYLLNFFIFDFN